MAVLTTLIVIWADLVATYDVMWAMQAYLTNVWNLGFTDAAAIMNVALGVSKILPFFFYFIVNTAGLGNKWMLLISSLSYAIGLGFLSMSTPPVLAKATGTCAEYEPQCVGDAQKILFYTALGLIAVGISGHVVSLIALFDDQIKGKVEDDRMKGKSKGPFIFELEEYDKMRRRPLDRRMMSIMRRVAERKRMIEIDLLGLQFQPVEAMVALVTQHVKRKANRAKILVFMPPIVLFFVAYISAWSVRVGVPAFFTLVATLFFVASFRRCKEKAPKGGPATNVFRVIFAAISKMFIIPPTTPDLLYENQTSPVGDDHDHNEKLVHTSGILRFLDKAAIDEGIETRRWILCTVTEVEQTKLIIHMFPILITFILCGLVSAVGSTYFTEQAKNMDYMVGKLKVTDTVILILYETGKAAYSRIYKAIQSVFGYKWTPRIGIGLAIMFGTLCCIVSALVETRRIRVIRAHSLIERPDDTIPMTVFWLLPQYLLLAGLDSFYEDSVTHFLCDLSPKSMQKYLVFLNPALSGVGIIGNVLAVHVVGRISEKNGKQNWFQHDLNASRLDRYYWTLASISALNFLWFLLCAYLYPYRETIASHDDEENGSKVVSTFLLVTARWSTSRHYK